MIYILKTNFYPEYTNALLQNATKVLKAEKKEYQVIEVAGVGELPVVAATLLTKKEKNVQGLLCLGIIIKGETDHYEWLINQVERGLSLLTLEHKLPIIQGIVPADNENIIKKRLERGGEWAETLLATTETLKNLSN